MDLKEKYEKIYFKNFDKDVLRGYCLIINAIRGNPDFTSLTSVDYENNKIGKAVINITNNMDFSMALGQKVEIGDNVLILKELLSVAEMEVKVYSGVNGIFRGGKYRLTFPLFSFEMTNEKPDIKRSDLYSFDTICDSHCDPFFASPRMGFPEHFGMLMEMNDLKERAKYAGDSEAKVILQKIKDICDESVENFYKMDFGTPA